MKTKNIEVYKYAYQRIEEFAEKNDASMADVVEWLVEYLDDVQKDLDR